MHHQKYPLLQKHINLSAKSNKQNTKKKVHLNLTIVTGLTVKNERHFAWQKTVG